MNIISIIPARMNSSRFPGKPLEKILGIPMIGHCYQRSIMCNDISETYVATCDIEIKNYIDSIGGKTIMTSNSHERATDRTAEAMIKIEKQKQKKIDIVVMIQGDEPMIDIEDIKNLNSNIIKNKSEIATLACKIKDRNILNKKNVVKVITDKELSKENISTAKTFSREVLFNYNSCIYHHIGIYIYKVSILEKFVNLKQSKNEINQKLEQLRAIDNGIEINVILANSSPIGVDTEEDFLEIKKIMNYKN